MSRLCDRCCSLEEKSSPAMYDLCAYRVQIRVLKFQELLFKGSNYLTFSN